MVLPESGGGAAPPTPWLVRLCCIVWYASTHMFDIKSVTRSGGT